jgi:hypothetical protein
MPSISQGFISLISQNGLKREDKRNKSLENIFLPYFVPIF